MDLAEPGGGSGPLNSGPLNSGPSMSRPVAPMMGNVTDDEQWEEDMEAAGGGASVTTGGEETGTQVPGTRLHHWLPCCC